MRAPKRPPKGWSDQSQRKLRRLARRATKQRPAPTTPDDQPLPELRRKPSTTKQVATKRNPTIPDEELYAYMVPIRWLHAANNLGAACARIVPVLLQRASSVHYATVVASHQELATWGVSLRTVREALHTLRRHQLVRVTAGSGHDKSRIKLLFSGYWKQRMRRARDASLAKKAARSAHA